MTRSNLRDQLCTALAATLPRTRVEEALKHYEILTRSYQLGQYEICLLNGGKFVEAVCKCLHYRRTGEDRDAIQVTPELQQLQQARDGNTLDETGRILLPHTLRIIYDHRNQRGGAHNNAFDPNAMDAKLVVESCKWVLEELTRLYHTGDPDAAQKIVSGLLVKEIPLVEEIGDDFLVLHPRLSARIQLEILLYQRHPTRTALQELTGWLGHTHKEHNVRVTLSTMKKKTLVHENEAGWLLTQLGLQEAETEIARLLNGNGAKPEKHKSTRRSTRRGRK